MRETLIHLFGDVRPFDWVMLAVEVLVLGLIAYEVIVGIRHRLVASRQNSQINERRSWVSEFLTSGEQLRREVPREAAYMSDSPTFQPWIKRVEEWSAKTAESLAKFSPKAAIAFSLVDNAGVGEVIVYAPNPTGESFVLQGKVRIPYQRLVQQMASLTQIMEKADFYF